MDDWDPLVANGFALDRDVILFDNVGVGSSGGETSSMPICFWTHVNFRIASAVLLIV
jgi:hypothetical protein